MAQQAQQLPVYTKPASLDYLDHPSPNHTFLYSVFAGVVASWAVAIYLALTFTSP
jgi:hypothetical protein